MAKIQNLIFSLFKKKISIMENKTTAKNFFKKHKKTKHREKIIEILNLFELPAEAEDIMRMFNYNKEKISLSTIYRNLELLTREGIIKKSLIMDTNKAKYELNREGEHRHYIVCVKCNQLKPLLSCPFNDMNIKKIEEDTEYKITAHKFELYGYCPNCVK